MPVTEFSHLEGYRATNGERGVGKKFILCNNYTYNLTYHPFISPLFYYPDMFIAYSTVPDVGK